ncbi:MAG TPA: glycosyltransferase family 4 protein, partial [Chloroflexota bacterium]
QMEARGARLVLFAFKNPGENIHNPTINQVQAPVYYLEPANLKEWLQLAAEHARLLFTSPRNYGETVILAFQSVIAGGRFRPFFLAGRLTQRVRELGIDHLHAHFANKPTAIARYTSVLMGVPFSFTAHAKDLYLSAPDSIAGKAIRAEFITTCTGYNADYLRDILLPADRDKVRTVYHGVDTKRFSPRSQAVANDPPVIISVGRLVPKKGHAHVVEAAKLLRERGVRFRLDIYGQGDLRKPLQEQIEGAGLADAVRLHGARTQDELIEVYHRADAFVLAPVITPNGDRDGIPNVLLEAMATGLPAVSTAISGIPEVITDGVNGLLVPSGDPVALAGALECLITNPMVRQHLGSQASQTIRDRFDAGENAEHMAALLGLQGAVHAHRVHSG